MCLYLFTVGITQSRAEKIVSIHYDDKAQSGGKFTTFKYSVMISGVHLAERLRED